MKLLTVLCSGLMVVVVALESRGDGAWNITTNGVNSVTGWQTNGTLLEAVNLGCPLGNTNVTIVDPGTYDISNVIPATVNGITFGTNFYYTSVVGSGSVSTSSYAYYASDYNPYYGDEWYTGSDTNQQNLYWTWEDSSTYESPYYLGIQVGALNAINNGDVYQIQALYGVGWPDNEVEYGGSTGGADTFEYQYITNDTSIYSVTWTWTATNAYGELDIIPTGDSGEDLIFGYTLSDLSSGAPGIYLTTTVSPTNNPVYTGTPITFNAMAYGQNPLYFYWLTNGVPVSGPTTGVAGETYTIASAATANTGSYSLLASNTLGTATSAPIAITVISGGLTNISQPLSALRLQNANYSFVGNMVGSEPIQYQWKLNGNSISGATNSTLTLTGIQPANAGGYILYATNGFGTLTTTSATMQVIWDAAQNPQFGDFGGTVTNVDGTNWNAEFSYVSAAVGSGGYMATNGYPTWDDPQTWQSCWQDTGLTIQPNTTYIMSATVWGPTNATETYGTACYMTMEDENLTNATFKPTATASNWIVLNNVRTAYTTNSGTYHTNLYIYNGTSYYYGPLTEVYLQKPVRVTDSFNSTNLVGDNGGAGASSTVPLASLETNSVIGHELAIRIRNDGEGNDLYVANVVLSVIGPPTLGNPNVQNVTNYYFTVNSWPSNSYYVLSSTNLAISSGWQTNATITNYSGANVFTNAPATNSARFFMVKQHGSAVPSTSN